MVKREERRVRGPEVGKRVQSEGKRGKKHERGRRWREDSVDGQGEKKKRVMGK